MKKIIGRGVLLLETAPGGPGLKFAYQLDTEGIQFYSLGKGSKQVTIKEAVSGVPLNAPGSVTGRGHILLDAIPASPNDAFYNLTFKAANIGQASESFSLTIVESGAFAHGPQCHFSGLVITFEHTKAKGISVASGGSVSLHLHEEVFSGGATVPLVPQWEKDTLVFTASGSGGIKMDSIGTLKEIRVETGSAYDRWSGIQGWYTFDGGMTAGDSGAASEGAAHDCSGLGAPSLFFDGREDFKEKPNEQFGAKWTTKGIVFTGNAVLATPPSAPNPVIKAVQQSESFSVEIWLKPDQILQEGPAHIFALESTPNTPRKFFSIGQGPWTDGKFKKSPEDPAGDYLNVNIGPPETAIPVLKAPYWEKPFISPEKSLRDEQMHVVYAYDQENGAQRIFVNGELIAQKIDRGYYSDWNGALRIAVGNNLKKEKPWKGEILHLAIFSRALTAEEVSLHYRPALSITGNFSFSDEVVNAPLKGEIFPFNLNIGQETATLTAARTVDFDINPGLGFRHVHVECTKRPDSPWAFSGKFQTRFWNDVVPLQARLKTVAGTTALELSSGMNPERPADPLILENALPGARALRLCGPRLTLTAPIRLEGKWLNQDMAFTSDAQYIWAWNHEQDYYPGRKPDGTLYIHLGASAAGEPRIEDILPRIFTTDLPAPGLRSPAGSPVLELTQSGTGCTLTMNLKGAKDSDIRAAFDNLLAQAEDKGLKAGGLQLLRGRIAERLPLEYDSLLYYYYGWDVSKNYMDLHPGMQLRVDFQQYQFVHATEQRAKKGFVGSGSITVPVNSYTGDDGTTYLGFGPFLSRLQADKRGSLSEEGAGGLLDLVKVGGRKPYFRLFFPNESISATAPERSVTIVGANSWKDLPKEMPLTGASNSNQISFFFRDKAMVTPEIQVFVWNQAVYVPLGTTVRQLIERYANIPFASAAGPNLQAFLGRARPMRLTHTGADNTPDYRFLHFGENSTGNTRDVFDLPLVKGDRFYF